MPETNKKTKVALYTAISFSVFAVVLFIVLNNIPNSQNAEAAAADNVTGWAWSENIGWISFNSINCDSAAPIGQSDGGAGCPPAGTPMSSYGVNMNGAGELSGYAWSENIGWISFNRADTGVPPGAPYNGAETFVAKVNGANELTGWAQALAFGGGWDGWIKMRKDPADSGANYGVSLVGNDFTGWAWGSSVVGWVSFNSTNCDSAAPLGQSDGGAGCPPAGTPMSSYKVYITGNAPIVTPLAPWTPADYCGTTSPEDIFLSWNYNSGADGDPQDSYELSICKNDDDNDSSTCIGGGKVFCGTGQISGAAVAITAEGINDDYCGANFVEYGNYAYSWSIKVWDSSSLSDGPESGVNFSTPVHEYPTVTINSASFVGNPILGQVEFVYSAKSYGPNNLIRLEWDYDITDNGGVFMPDETINVAPPVNCINTAGCVNVAPPNIHTYTIEPCVGSGVPCKAILKAYDDTPFNCPAEASVDVDINIPKWKEVSPSS